MRFEWKRRGSEHVARVGEWKLEASPHAGVLRVAVYLEGVEVDVTHVRFDSLDEAKATAERWVLEYVAPFVEAAVEAEREACAEIAMRHTIRPGLVLTGPGVSFTDHTAACASVNTATDIAREIRARRDGVK